MLRQRWRHRQGDLRVVRQIGGRRVTRLVRLADWAGLPGTEVLDNSTVLEGGYQAN